MACFEDKEERQTVVASNSRCSAFELLFLAFDSVCGFISGVLLISYASHQWFIAPVLGLIGLKTVFILTSSWAMMAALKIELKHYVQLFGTNEHSDY